MTFFSVMRKEKRSPNEYTPIVIREVLLERVVSIVSITPTDFRVYFVCGGKLHKKKRENEDVIRHAFLDFITNS